MIPITDKRKILPYLILILSFTNASLRLTESGMSSLYRILVPVLAIFIMIRKSNIFIKEVIVFVGIILYSIIISLFNYQFIAVEYYVFALYIFFALVMVQYLKSIDSNFINSFWKFLDIVCMVTLVFALFQIIFRFNMPFVVLPKRPGVNLWYSNENELCVPLAFMSIIYFYKCLFYKEKMSLIKFTLIIFVTFICDAKLSLMGILVASLFLIYYKFHETVKINNKKFGPVGVTGLIVILFFFIVTGLIIIDPTLIFRDYKIRINDLLFTAVKAVLTNQPLPGSGGSLVDRTNAIIYGLRELYHTGFSGIGFGNSTVMLKTPQYILLTAKSMHNIMAQFLCELGVISIITYSVICYKLIKGIKYVFIDSKYLLKLAFAIGFVFISAQSSIGIMSNYHAWAIVFFVILI